MCDFQMIRPDEPYCSIYNEVTSSVHTYKKKGSEPVYVDYVAVDVKNKKHLQKVSQCFCMYCKRYKIVG